MPRGGRRGSDTPPVPPTTSAWADAWRLLGRRDYTTQELRDKLLSRGHADEAVGAALTRLTSEGALDDRRAATGHVRTAARVKGRGRLRIARELEARGISKALTNELLADVSEEDTAAQIAKFLDRKKLPAQPDQATRRRVFQQLLRRGFPSDAISKALRKRHAAPEDD
jgi:regulatory protein